MATYVILMVTTSVMWLGLEVWLSIRDHIRGQGKPTLDRGTKYTNFAATGGALVAASIVNGFEVFWFPGGRTPTVFWIGLGLMWLGLLLRVWAIVVLGDLFRTTVELDKNHPVVRKGPYRWIRHPSYSGILLACVGYGLALQNWLSLALVVLCPTGAFLYRIRVEEAALIAGIGAEYEDYRRSTRLLIPGIW